MKVVIEASNIRAGGGVTHLVECLSALEVERWDIESVTVVSGISTLDRLENRPWLRKIVAERILGGFFRDMRSSEAGTNLLGLNGDILLVPGGSYIGPFRPFVALAQNLLPFDSIEQKREGWSLKRLRLLLLARVQGATFRRADGVIYMSSISRMQIERRLGFTAKKSRVVHHGTNSRFFGSYKLRIGLDAISGERPFRLLYVSVLDYYKHQKTVVAAVAKARARGLAVTLDLVGPAAVSEQHEIRRYIDNSGANSGCIRYHGPVGYDRLKEIYATADAFVFASSCETFGIILLEAMAGGLPLLCSHRSALPEVVGCAPVFFDPLSSNSLAEAIGKVYIDPLLQRSMSFQGRQQAVKFSWKACAAETFGFLSEIYNESKAGVNT